MKAVHLVQPQPFGHAYGNRSKPASWIVAVYVGGRDPHHRRSAGQFDTEAEAEAEAVKVSVLLRRLDLL